MDISAIRLKNATDLKESCNSMAEFARKVGKEPTQVRHWFNPNVNKNIGNKIAREIEVAFNKPFGWMDIITHESEASYLDYATEEHKAKALHQYKQNVGTTVKDTQIQIPILDIEASGGMGAINDSELVADSITLEKSYLHEFGLPTDNLKIITIRGDSMSPELESGDLVLVHNVPLAAHEMHDGMFVVLIEEMLYIKRLQRLPGKRIKVISTNREAYDPFEVACNDVDILGRVVFAWRGKKF